MGLRGNSIYLLYRLGGWLIPRAPLRLTYWCADRAGELAYCLSRRRRVALRANLRRVLGARADAAHLERVCRWVFRNAARNVVDMFRLPRMTREQVERLVTIHGWEHAERAIARGKGVILTSAHFGGANIAVQVAICRGLRPVILHERLQPERLYRYVAGLRASMGLAFLPVGEPSSLKEAFRVLKHNGLLGIMADRDVSNNGRAVRFFGETAHLPDGHVTLALRTGATILMAFSRRRPDNHFEVHIEPPIIVEPTGDKERDIQTGLERVTAILEKYIRAYPDQWVYFQPVWKRRDTDDKDAPG